MESFKDKRQVKLSDLRDFFCDREAVDKILKTGDPVVYEVFEYSQPEVDGQINFGVTVLYPGKVGNEYFLTKGHYHTKENTAELYVGLKGDGIMLMQTKDGQLSSLSIKPGYVVYVPPFWAHRTINVGKKKLTFFFVYPSDSGHDYGTIKEKGFAKLVIEERGKPKIVDNPRFKH
ncbi:MAG: glucose-6-phosphate isomerase [Nitrososphaerota archaeon]|nr:glucose-6-phosphate isomerase [Nitrososphaerota archaeon]